MAEKRLTYDEMVDEGVKLVIRAFGKGEDLRGAISVLVSGTALWAEANLKAEKKGKSK